MTLDQVIGRGTGWTQSYGSSACGRYQFMKATLESLKTEHGLKGNETMTPAFQDMLGYALLRRRQYLMFEAGQIGVETFGLRLAQEWASFPVLVDCPGAHRAVKRGQSYYTGDGKNKALVPADAVEAMLHSLRVGAPPVIAPVGTNTEPGGVTYVKLPASGWSAFVEFLRNVFKGK